MKGDFRPAKVTVTFMKILMLAASLRPGGAETHIFELACALKGRGHDVSVVSGGGALSESLAQKGIRHIKMRFSTKNPAGLIISYFRLRALIKRENYDIVHSHTRITSFICRFAVRRRETRFVTTVHARFRTGPLLRLLSFWGDSTVAVSEDLRQYLSSNYGLCADNITVIPNGIDTVRFLPQQKRHECGHIVFVSRMDPDCSLCAELLCRITPRLVNRFPGVRITLAGGGKSFGKISRLAARANEIVGYECVSTPGFVGNVPELLCDADVFVGVSRAALEAMACGIPVVLAGNEGFMGVADASVMGAAENTNFCCRGSRLPDGGVLMDSLETLFEMSTREREELGGYLRDYVCRNNSIMAVAEKTERFYRSVPHRHKAARGDIVFLGYYGFGNIGDDAVLGAALKKAGTLYEGKNISVITHSPSKTALKYGVRCVRRENIAASHREIKRAQTLVLGGGSILQNVTSTRSLLWYASFLKYAYSHGVRSEMWGNGLGPFRGRFAKRIAARTLSHCTRIGLRDEMSVETAMELGVPRGNITLEDDLALYTPACSDKRTEFILSGLGLSGKRFFLAALGGGTRRAERKRVYEICRQLREESHLYPLFVVMHGTEDKRISERSAKKCGGKSVAGLTPSELLGLTRRAECALGNRYHMSLFAHMAGIPCRTFGGGRDPKLLSASLWDDGLFFAGE